MGDALTFDGRETMMGQELASRHQISNIRANAFTYTIDLGPSAGALRRSLTIEYTRA